MELESVYNQCCFMKLLRGHMLFSQLSKIIGVNSCCQSHLLDVIEYYFSPYTAHFGHGLILMFREPHDLSILNLSMKAIKDSLANDDWDKLVI